jgi:hypothetical protein
MKRSLIIFFVLFCFVLTSSVVLAQKKLMPSEKTTKKRLPKVSYVDKFGKPDTCSIEVKQDKKGNKAVATVTLFNDEKVAALTVPLRFGDGKTPIYCDSVSFAKTRVDYFQLKSALIDSANQTVLIGLIADLSGKVPALDKGTGEVAHVYFTWKKGAKAEAVTLDTTFIHPSNTLKLVTENVKDIIPYWDNKKAQIEFRTAK